MGVGIFNQLSDAMTFVTRQIVHNHHIALAKFRNEYLFNERLENVAVNRAVHDRRTTHTADAQRSDKRCGFPVAMRYFVDQTLAARCATSQPCHVRLGPGLINEDQALPILANRVNV